MRFRGKGQDMKQPSKPTRAQKEIIAENGLVPGNWMVIEEDREVLEVISKRSAMRKVLKKPEQTRRRRK